MTQTHVSPARAPRALRELIAGFVADPPDALVSDLTLDSREATPGAAFLACRGRTHHGLEFAPEAVARGARTVLYEPEGAPRALPTLSPQALAIPVHDLTARAGLIADRFFGEPSQRLTVAGITGTNGKTTCAWLLAQALQHCGRPCGYLGTLGAGMPPQVHPTRHTTPDAVTVHRELAALAAAGAECVSMEVSSHALDQSRVNGVRFHTAAFTNLTRDHLDYHGSMEAYGTAKARLFDWPGLSNRIINVDDPFGAALATAAMRASRLIVTARASPGAPHLPQGAKFVTASRVRPGPFGLTLEVESSWGAVELAVRLMGDFNVDNSLTVLAVLLAWEIPLREAAQALSRVRPASGRMEMFGGRGRSPLAIVDYAHTPDALAKALRAARLHCRGQLRVVFGCGGDRDAGKRPLMGEVAAQLADDIVLTDDNPRSEDPRRIVADIVAGIGERTPLVIEHDRSLAIRMTLQRSAPDDVVLIAGKGHEDYQIVGHERRAFRDQAIVADELGRLPP
jgi:UDP-N-acetylmuramoyl-L-alanyl-D-glutamate--2,6-diaminopimelate ligase